MPHALQRFRQHQRGSTSVIRGLATVAVMVVAACANHAGPGAYACNTPPSDLASCTTDADCAMVARGCYCGAQPVDGVAQAYLDTADACETQAAATCALGCANTPGKVAQDGNMVIAGGTIAVRCDTTHGTPGTCMTYVP